jgi:hypothetical protein
MTRAQAYAWMRRTMKLTEAEAHILLFGVEQCESLAKLVKQRLPELRNDWDRLREDDSF